MPGDTLKPWARVCGLPAHLNTSAAVQARMPLHMHATLAAQTPTPHECMTPSYPPIIRPASSPRPRAVCGTRPNPATAVSQDAVRLIHA